MRGVGGQEGVAVGRAPRRLTGADVSAATADILDVELPAEKYNIASPGAGATTHLTAEQFRTSLGLDLALVPFNGGGPAIASVIAGHTQVMFSSVATAAAQIKARQLRPLAVTGKTRSAMLPEVPTTTEAGYPDIEGDNWVGSWCRPVRRKRSSHRCTARWSGSSRCRT